MKFAYTFVGAVPNQSKRQMVKVQGHNGHIDDLSISRLQ